jgi:hypothetical protein
LQVRILPGPPFLPEQIDERRCGTPWFDLIPLEARAAPKMIKIFDLSLRKVVKLVQNG